MPGASIDGHPHGLEGMVPWIGYDGVTYGYMTAEEAYHQQMYGYNYMAHVPQTGEPVETDIQLGEEEAGKEDGGDEQQQQQKEEADKEAVEEQVVPAFGQSQGCEDDEGDRSQVPTSSNT
ncbi:hypothetical protein BGX34_003958 [Mortierella sp. NVP85]|nr:hypothetical protein BGX34_003958 [Mortierella sp. NVP85]